MFGSKQNFISLPLTEQEHYAALRGALTRALRGLPGKPETGLSYYLELRNRPQSGAGMGVMPHPIASKARSLSSGMPANTLLNSNAASNQASDVEITDNNQHPELSNRLENAFRPTPAPGLSSAPVLVR